MYQAEYGIDSYYYCNIMIYTITIMRRKLLVYIYTAVYTSYLVHVLYVELQLYECVEIHTVRVEVRLRAQNIVASKE